jgi:hypothetical protein
VPRADRRPGKLLQLTTPEEIQADAVQAQRSTTTGSLRLSMPKTRPFIAPRAPPRPAPPPAATAAAAAARPPVRGVSAAELGAMARGAPGSRAGPGLTALPGHVPVRSGPEPPPAAAAAAAAAADDDDVDEADVPPLE